MNEIKNTKEKRVISALLYLQNTIAEKQAEYSSLKEQIDDIINYIKEENIVDRDKIDKEYVNNKHISFCLNFRELMIYSGEKYKNDDELCQKIRKVILPAGDVFDYILKGKQND